MAVNPDTGEVLASALTSTAEGDPSLIEPLLNQIERPIGTVLADGANDGEPVYRSVAVHSPAAAVIIPPCASAVPSATATNAPSQRDRHIQLITERGWLGWQWDVQYGRRSLIEVAMMRYKQLLGRTLSLPDKKVGAAIACKVMNFMTSLGMPLSRKSAWAPPPAGCPGLRAELRAKVLFPSMVGKQMRRSTCGGLRPTC